MSTHTESETEIRHWLAEQVGGIVGRASHDVLPDELMAEYGVDSLHAIALTGAIEERWGVGLDATVAWEYPTIALLAEFLAAEIAVGAVD
ncbi:acyl carrier protein [Streptomyces sp. NPDC051662]|uniref:acyl carrier protein n=1 Tax=Streptomyces sp. NPDC051662 TaxID=3154750 RepID=UPI0034364123